MKAEFRGPGTGLLGYPGSELPRIAFPPRKALLYRDGQVFFAGGEIAETFSTRGYGKTWFLMTVALMLSAGKSAMGFDAREARRVLYVDGEIARQDIQSRFAKLVECTGIPPSRIIWCSSPLIGKQTFCRASTRRKVKRHSNHSSSLRTS